MSGFVSGACPVRVWVRVRFATGFVSGSCPVRVWVRVRVRVSGSCLVNVWVGVWFVIGRRSELYLIRI